MASKEIDSIKDAGVVGAGGAGFPTHVKLDAKIENLIVNAAECEPLIDVDKQLLEKEFATVLEGLKIAANLTGAKRVIIALKAKYKKAIAAIESYQKKGFDFELCKMGNFYPAGDEQTMVYEATGRIVPEGGIPLMVGCVVINVETLLNVAQAVKGIKVTQKYVTLNGEVANPTTIKVPVGTPVKLLLDYVGGITADEYAVYDGGPMMGKLIDQDSYAVKKTTKSIMVLPADNIVTVQKNRSASGQIKRGQAACLSCRMCTDLCPRYLLGHDLFPDEMMKRLYKGELNEQDIENFDYAYLCCDCGLCELYACIVDLSPRAIFNHLKVELAKRGIKNPHQRKDLEANEFKAYRKIPVSRLRQRLEIDHYPETELVDFTGKVEQVKLYFSQHVGAPSSPVVKVGDLVPEGGLVADIPQGKLGARIHSSISGKVLNITSDYVEIGKG
ncbi:MAG: SLBB domain-containing protein [Actinomycetota bacterium]|nr:SLBB domain-containing protein [Actinomycetota bacterium]